MKMKLLLILSILTFISCEPASVDLDNENYEFDGKGGVKCEVNGMELKPRETILSPSSKELIFQSYMGDEFLTLSFNNRDENNAFLAVRMVVKNLNPYETDLTGLIINLEDDNKGMYSINVDNEYSTNLEYIGEFEIEYHDQNERILAGRFWYDAVNSVNEIKEIRNGEFDMKYY